MLEKAAVCVKYQTLMTSEQHLIGWFMWFVGVLTLLVFFALVIKLWYRYEMKKLDNR